MTIFNEEKIVFMKDIAIFGRVRRVQEQEEQE
jgi:hypothetical protein